MKSAHASGAPPNRSENAPAGTNCKGVGEIKERSEHSTACAAIKPTRWVQTLAPILERIDRAHCWIRRVGADAPTHREVELTNASVNEHIHTATRYGACPIRRGTSTTRLALFDLDDHKGEASWPQIEAAASMVMAEMRNRGLAPHAFRSSGGKGMHIFALWAEEQDAHSVRQAMREVLNACGFRDGAGGVVAGQIEVFPKQDSVAANDCGSMFILPLHKHSVPWDDLVGLLSRDDAHSIDWTMSAPVPMVRKAERPERFGDIDRPGVARVVALLREVEPEFWRESTDREWFDCMCAAHHGSSGAKEVLDVFDELSSSGGEKYKGRRHVETRWRSLDKDEPNAVTIETLEALVRKQPATLEDFDDLSSVPSKPKRSTVTLTAGRQPAALAAIGRLLVAGSNYYGHMVYGDAIVKPYMALRRGFRGEPVHALELNRLTPAALAADLNEFADFVRVKKAKGGSKQTVRLDCPPTLAAVFMERPEKWSEIGLPYIDRITETPILRDGELLARPGYSAEAAAYIQAPQGVELRAPLTRDTARESLRRVREWLSEFPFETAIDESVACSAMLTAALRASLPTAPGFVLDKPDFGAGASTLAKLIHIVLTGREPAVTTADRGEEELSKNIDALQIAGAASVVIDNIAQGEKLRSLALTQLLSEPYRKPRVLGASRNVTVTCMQMVLVTGVNVGVADDLVRRFVRCRIDPKCERPQERVFKRPRLLDEARARRAELLSDLYTITAAYLQSGAAVRATNLAGFDQWSAHCAEPLVWLGMADPIASGKALAQEDPSRSDLSEVLRLWEEAHGDKLITTGELLNALEWDDFDAGNACRERIVQAVGGDRVRDLNAAVGRYLSARKGTVAAGRRVEVQGARQGAKLWKVTRIGPEGRSA